MANRPGHEEASAGPTTGGRLRTGGRLVFIAILLIGLVVSFLADATRSITSNQLYVAIVLLVALFFEDAKELVIGPFLTIKRGIEEVQREQARISQNLQAAISLQARQTNVVQFPPQLSDDQLRKSQEAVEEADRLKVELSEAKEMAKEHATNATKMEALLRRSLELNDRAVDAMERWEFRYLDLLLNENTKRVLNRLVASGEQHIGELAQFNPFSWQDFATSIDTLQASGLVELKAGDIIAPTEKAREFLRSIRYEDKISENIIRRMLRKTPPQTPPATQSSSK